MSRSISSLIVCVLLVCACALPSRAQETLPRSAFESVPLAEDPFLSRVDISPFESIAVFHGGRLKSYESFATEMVSYIAGRTLINDQPHSLTYLDMIFRPERYIFSDTIYIKKKPIRARFADALAADAPAIVSEPDLYPGAQDASVEQRRVWLEERIDTLMDTGMISERLLGTDAGFRVVQDLSRDLIRTAKAANQIRNAQGLKDPEVLVAQLAVIPPRSGAKDQPWFTTNELFGASAATEIDLDQRTLSDLRSQWSALAVAWQSGDAMGVNRSLEQLGATLPTIAPQLYPKSSRLEWETWYFKSYHMTWVWLIYLMAVVFLLLSVVYKWPTARFLGLGTFVVAFGFHTFAIWLRWYISGRWPNTNMFEAVTTSVWFGAALALGIELFARKSSMRNLFALTASVASMAAMMAAYYLPQLDPSINNMMPILHDLWLYIHTNVIIASYALIAMAAVPAFLYVVRRVFGGSADYAKVGGAATFLDERTKGSKASHKASSLGEVCDGATMVLLELAFVMLWAGLVMGAIWADHSWGRPWGWDPKEVFALNTFLVFLILIHVRLKAKDKGLWTALLALAGAGVMLFNWIVINFVITGLHSYA
ncbi:MAG: cytochrome c biogenesis protein CcsA [Phycisphaerales bacterium]